MMTELVNLTQAKQYLRAPLAVVEDDDAIYLQLQIAHGLVLDYVKQYCSSDPAAVDAWIATVNGWTSDTAPAGVIAAILQTLADLDARPLPGGDRTSTDEARRYKSLTPTAAGFLVRLRDPAVR